MRKSSDQQKTHPVGTLPLDSKNSDNPSSTERITKGHGPCHHDGCRCPGFITATHEFPKCWRHGCGHSSDEHW